MSNEYDGYLAFAKELAAKARGIALKYYKTNLEFETKEDDSPVTLADKEVNDMVVRSVQSQFPEHGVLGEEETWHEERNILWVCDPIDGTIAFSMGEPTFMFSLALVIDGEPMIAVAAELANGDVYWASRGSGSYRNETPIHVSNRTMDKSWLLFPSDLKSLLADQSLYQTLNERSYQSNIVHGGVFKGMMIAQGLADATVYLKHVQPWDMASVRLIVEEAGGKFTNQRNEPHRVDQELTDGVIISNGFIHDELLEAVTSAR